MFGWIRDLKGGLWGPRRAATALVAGLLCGLAVTGAARAAPVALISESSSGLNAGSVPVVLAAGPDGNLWFVDQGTTKAIGRITPTGQITEFSAGLNAGSLPVAIAAGPDGNLWFADEGTTKAIGRITPAGAITEFSAA